MPDAAPRINPLTPDELAAAGRALHGERWPYLLAAELGISDRNLRYWMAGERSPRDPDEVRARLVELLAAKGDEVRETLRRIKRPSAS